MAPGAPVPISEVRGRWQVGKRTLDLVLTVVAVLFLMPLLAAVAIAIRFSDGGPVLHRRRVVGRNGEFDAFKFRSMRVDADHWLETRPALRAAFERDFKLRGDPRVTPLGRWLRRFSIDELPQLFNVIRGEMSLVGPRMVSPPELAKFGAFAQRRQAVRPGLTGYWQVYGRQQVSYEERVQMDRKYLDEWSLWLDCKLILLTPWAAIRGKGAY